MAKCLIAAIIFIFIFIQLTFCQSTIAKIPKSTGNVNDWESLFTEAQKSQLDSACTYFAFTTNVPIAVVTFGAANTTKEASDDFIQKADSLLFQGINLGVGMAIFLSKDFRVLSVKANTPANIDTALLGGWKSKIQQSFTASVQPHVQLLKDAQYAKALLAILGDLAATVKKEF